MSEMFFIAKTLILTAVLTMLMQVKIGDVTLEERTVDWLENSSTAEWIQEVASGGAVAVTHLARKVREEVTGSDIVETKAREQRAGR